MLTFLLLAALLAFAQADLNVTWHVYSTPNCTGSITSQNDLTYITQTCQPNGVYWTCTDGVFVFKRYANANCTGDLIADIEYVEGECYFTTFEPATIDCGDVSPSPSPIERPSHATYVFIFTGGFILLLCAAIFTLRHTSL